MLAGNPDCAVCGGRPAKINGELLQPIGVISEGNLQGLRKGHALGGGGTAQAQEAKQDRSCRPVDAVFGLWEEEGDYSADRAVLAGTKWDRLRNFKLRFFPILDRRQNVQQD